jgi:hypothetical protein
MDPSSAGSVPMMWLRIAGVTRERVAATMLREEEKRYREVA